MFRWAMGWFLIGMVAWSILSTPLGGCGTARAAVTSEDVERAIRRGIRFLKDHQHPDGSWPEVEGQTVCGTTALVTLALLTAGEPADSATIQRALEFLRQLGPGRINSTYGVALQTMVFAAAEPERDMLRISANAEWLQSGQIRLGDRIPGAGSWTYVKERNRPGDNSNTQYALLGLNAASEAGVRVDPAIWALSRTYFEMTQNRDGGWSYVPRQQSTASMTCAGLSSLIIAGSRRYQGLEYLRGDAIHDCGKGGFNVSLMRGIDWLASHFDVRQNFPGGQQWKYYYLYGLERAARLAAVRFFGQHDWYREGAEEILQHQNKLTGFWRGGAQENELVATSFALLFLAKGRAPVLINKLRHSHDPEWNNDPDDVRNMVRVTSSDWKHLLTWQVVDPGRATIQDMLQAPIAFFNGHSAPEFNALAKQNLREFVEQGGFIFGEACCGRREFDEGFKRLMKQVFPEEEYQLRPLASDHPVWRARHVLSPEIHELWGIEHGCRTVVIYSPQDLSCYWNQSETSAANPAVIKALRVGQNVIDYATGREMPADKLATHEVTDFKGDSPKRGALRIAKLKHAGDWNIAPQAIPNLMDVLRRPPLKFDVVITQKELHPRDPSLVYYPLIYIHGRGAWTVDKEDLDALRIHLEPGGGTVFADAACGSPAFDTSFRRFVAELLPNNPLVPIPLDDELYSGRVGFKLNDVNYTGAAGGAVGPPQLEGIKINEHWAVIYSKFDIGCALERHTGIDCKGYTHESAVKIAANIVIYATLP
jgi:hypothetical protein